MTKKGLLTKAERTALEKLLSEGSFKGKKSLEYLIWLNSTKPKYKVGDCFKVTDRGQSFFGVKAVNINGRIKSVESFRNFFEYRYTLEAHIVNKDGRELTTIMCADESDLKVRVKDNENLIDGDSKIPESIAVCI